MTNIPVRQRGLVDVEIRPQARVEDRAVAAREAGRRAVLRAEDGGRDLRDAARVGLLDAREDEEEDVEHVRVLGGGAVDGGGGGVGLEAEAERVEVHAQGDVGSRRLGVPAAPGCHDEGEARQHQRGLHHEGPLQCGEVGVQVLGDL